jgi:hypothetical protein
MGNGFEANVFACRNFGLDWVMGFFDIKDSIAKAGAKIENAPKFFVHKKFRRDWVMGTWGIDNHNT